MTEKELDAFMSKVLLDAIAFDEDRLEEKIPYAASARHRRQMRAMLKIPCVGQENGASLSGKGAADSSSHIIDAVIGTWQRDACQPDRSGDDCSVGYRMV